ncbi:MAG: hypothetical protein ACEPOW_11045 [Bacteroidales bacterium]
MKLGNLFAFIVVFFCLGGGLLAQENEKKDNRIIIPAVHFDVGYNWVSGDRGEAVNSGLVAGGGFLLKDRKNFMYDLEFSYAFSDKVKNYLTVFPNLITKNGLILDNSGANAAIDVSMRSYSFMFKVGKILIPMKKNKECGFFLNLGAGYMESFFRIKGEEDAVPQLRNDYAKVYDQLRGGFVTSQSIGYVNFGDDNLRNFIVEFEVKENFSKSLRKYDMVLQKKDTKSYTDIYMGIKLKWMFPFKKKVKDYYYH